MTGGKLSGLLVSHRGNFEGNRGGTQICSEEYLETIRAAGVETHLHLLDHDSRISTRLRRRIVSSSTYDHVAPPAQIEELRRVVAETKPEYVFLNQVNLAGLAPDLRPGLGVGGKIILLSHGLESTDLLHHIRVSRELPLTGRIRPTPAMALGTALLKETMLRRHVDGVLVLSPFDAALESWLGSHKIEWVPRLVPDQRLDWRPSGDRLGYLGTIDHAPNFEGLVQAVEALEALKPQARPRIRVIGGPRHSGEWLQRKYASIDYLGPLPDAAAQVEVATWSAFLHPIFCAARGCSTKLAGAIGWGLPIVTTELGHRGYAWREGALSIGHTPAEFAARCVEALDPQAAARTRDGVLRVLASAPAKDDVARRIATFLASLRPEKP